nr:alpha-1,2-fucosyltransferase [uncultured Akkermansia sp.]
MSYLGGACSPCPDGGYSDPVTYRESRFSYRSIPDTVRRGALSGYFQSERYFKDFAEEIRSLFQPLIAPVRESTAGVHLRMGDYLQKTDVYHTPDAAFLNEAFKNLSDNIRTLVVFSDSPDLARKLVEDVPEARRFEIVMDEHETLDALRELTAMQELVLSCSSFSWWGAWLGSQQRVFIQKKWFTGNIEDEQDIFCPTWIKL